jgi:hypothetical protein
MPPIGWLDGIRNNRGRSAALGLDLAKGTKPTRRESFLELATVTVISFTFESGKNDHIRTLESNGRDDSVNRKPREVSVGTSHVAASWTQHQAAEKHRLCNPHINIDQA